RGRRLVLHPDGPARRLDRPARVRGDGPRLPAHPRPPPAPRDPLHGPPPHPRGRHRRPWMSPPRRDSPLRNGRQTAVFTAISYATIPTARRTKPTAGRQTVP